MQQMKYRLVGLSPLILHNGELANPLNPYVRKLNLLTKKGRGLKEEALLEEIAELEFLGSLYTEKDVIGIPPHVIFTVLRNGARKFKKGKTIESGIVIQDFFPLEYDGPSNPRELFRYTDGTEARRFVDQRMVGVQRNKVLRTRPFFKEWALPIWFKIDVDVVEAAEVTDYLGAAGVAGIGDARSLGYGRFEIAA